MIMLTVLAIPTLVFLLLGVFVVGASVGTTHGACIQYGSPPQPENSTDSQLSQLPLPTDSKLSDIPFRIESWQADFSSLDTPAGE